MRMRTWPILLAVALAGCGPSEPSTSANSAKPAIAVQGPGQRRMHELNEMDRAIALKRAIYDTGAACKRVTRSGYATEYGNLSMWVAVCADDRQWAVFISPDDQVQVRDCKDHAELGLPPCEIDWSKTRK
jgi:hypothetical protein